MNEEEFEELIRRRPDLKEKFHYVRGSRRQSGFYRQIPKTYRNLHLRPKPLLRSQLLLSEIAMQVYKRKLKGFKDGLPIVAATVQDKMKGIRLKQPKWKEVLEKLKRKEVEAIAREEGQ